MSAASAYAPALYATAATVLGATLGTAGVSSNFTAANLTATGVTAGTAGVNITTGGQVLCGATLNVGGPQNCTSVASGYSSAVALGAPANLISCSHATNNFFRLPAAAIGLACNAVNIGASTIGLIGGANGVCLVGVASSALATMDASGSGIELICDGTNWHKRAM